MHAAAWLVYVASDWLPSPLGCILLPHLLLPALAEADLGRLLQTLLALVRLHMSQSQQLTALLLHALLCRYAWAPYPDRNRYPYLCEKPQSLYDCNDPDAPPAPDVPACGCRYTSPVNTLLWMTCQALCGCTDGL
jgi:hypothetical protein